MLQVRINAHILRVLTHARLNGRIITYTDTFIHARIHVHTYALCTISFHVCIHICIDAYMHMHVHTYHIHSIRHLLLKFSQLESLINSSTQWLNDSADAYVLTFYNINTISDINLCSKFKFWLKVQALRASALYSLLLGALIV